MSVYVGKREYPYGRMKMSHMIADTLSELHLMAKDIGVDRKHFQNKEGKPHYDICKNKKKLAIAFGAIEIDDKEIVNKLKSKVMVYSDITDLVIVAKFKNGDIHQIALDKEQSQYLKDELPTYFKGGKVKILEEKIKGIEIINP